MRQGDLARFGVFMMNPLLQWLGIETKLYPGYDYRFKHSQAGGAGEMQTSELISTNSCVDDRLSSWKEIATYLKCGVRTVQRWETLEALPVHRHQHQKNGTVYAFRS